MEIKRAAIYYCVLTDKQVNVNITSLQRQEEQVVIQIHRSHDSADDGSGLLRFLLNRALPGAIDRTQNLDYQPGFKSTGDL